MASDLPILIFDFDSTFTQVEGLEELAEISLRNVPDAVNRKEEIVRLTEGAMNGTIPFDKALQERVTLLQAHKSHLPELVEILRRKVSRSIERNRSFFQKNAGNIYILSSGFREFIVPVVQDYGIREDHVYANSFVYSESGEIIGPDTANPLSQNLGKVQLIQSLGLGDNVYLIGDGFTDYEVRRAGLVKRFYCFTENVRREKVLARADAEAQTLDELLFQNHWTGSLSYPKNRIKVLALENIHPTALAAFDSEGYTIEVVPQALDEVELAEKIRDISILCLRSKTQVSAATLGNARKLLAIGTFCIGTNQVNFRQAQLQGIPVFNAPFSNTRSVVELALGEMIMLIRNIPEKNALLHRGQWDKSAGRSYEIRGKTLGIIGYGNIGTQLSVLAENMGMRVVFYDVVDKLALGNARRMASMQEVLQEADVVSIHVDGRRENHSLIGREDFDAMKEGVIFLNLARGHVVDMEAMEEALRTGKVAGAGLDVFPYEPKSNEEPFVSPLAKFDNVILTPHIGGSTQEAQESIGQYVSGKLIEYINTGSTFAAVNFPNIQLPHLVNAHRLIHVHENVAGVLASINSLLASRSINIVGQYLKTDESIGYVITEIERNYDEGLLEKMRQVKGTIKVRVLY